MLKRESRNPLISIVIPSYNKGDYIEETLKSITAQKYPNYEVIIQDGGSTDGTLEIIKKYAKKYPNLIKWTSRKDKGQADAINKGLRKANGKILTYINADDIYLKDAFAEVAKKYQENPGRLWFTGIGKVINENGESGFEYISKYKNLLLKLNNYKLLLTLNYIMQPSTFFTREAYKRFGPLTGTRKYVMEYEFWLKLGKVGMPVIIRKPLAGFRLIEGTISSTMFKELLRLDNRIAEKDTNNQLILKLHYLHNIGRIGAVKLSL